MRPWHLYRRFERWGERVIFTDHPAFWGILLCILIPPFGFVVLIAWIGGRSDGKAWGDPWDGPDPWAREGSRRA